MNVKRILILISLAFGCLALYATPLSKGEETMQIANTMQREQSKNIIENFYHYFNTENLEKLFTLISDEIENEINFEPMMKGKEKALEYMQYNMEHYNEKAHDYIYMISDDGRYVSVNLKVSGKYLKTDKSNIPALGQSYHLNVVNIFELKNNQIIKAKCYFNEDDLLQQLKKSA